MRSDSNATATRSLKRSAALMGITLLGATALSPLASASGSFGPSAGSNAQNPYNFGKRVYHKKVACQSCVLPSKSLNKNGAMMVVDKLKSDKNVMGKLSKRERSAVAHYLKKRYKF